MLLLAELLLAAGPIVGGEAPHLLADVSLTGG
jgi:hypothetical protein